MIKQNSFEKILKYAQMHIVQIVAASIVSLFTGFVTCKITTQPCVREVVCKEIIDDRNKLSEQLSISRQKCIEEKAELGKSLKDKFSIECDSRVKVAIENCDFSEKHHCPICKARGICK